MTDKVYLPEINGGNFWDYVDAGSQLFVNESSEDKRE